jgi:O-antigen ligase
MQSFITKCSTFLLALLVFAIPIEHKYAKLFRHFSLTLIPEGLIFPRSFDKKIYFYASDIAAILLFAAALFAFRSPLRSFVLEKGAPYLWLFFACSLLSVFLSPMASYPVIYTRFFQLLAPIFLFSYLAHCLPKENQTKLLFSVLIAAALLQSAIATLQYFTQSPLGLHILGEPKQATGALGVDGGYRWLFDSLFHQARSTNTVIRSCGTLPHCNVLGGYLALSLLATYSLIVSLPSNWLRRLLGLSLIVQFFALCISYSRSAIFAWAIGTVFWFGYSVYHRGFRDVFGDRAIRFLASMILVAVAINTTLLFDQLLHRGGIFNYNGLAKGSDDFRIGMHNLTYKIIEDHPLIGVGFQQFSSGAAAYLPPGTRPSGVHNIYLFLAAETGLISLAAFLGFIIALIVAGFRAPCSPRLASLLAMFIGLLFIGGCDYYLILFQQGRLMFFCVAGLLAAEGVFARRRGEIITL